MSFTATTNDTTRRALQNAFEKSLIDFNRLVFEEDKAICQIVQKGVAHTSLTGMLSSEEERVHAFQNVYITLMGDYASQN